MTNDSHDKVKKTLSNSLLNSLFHVNDVTTEAIKEQKHFAAHNIKVNHFTKDYKAENRLINKVVLITGGDCGLGRSIAFYFAKEGADVVLVYFNDKEDVLLIKNKIQQLGKKCLLLRGNIEKPKFCSKVLEKALLKFKKIDILVNNASEEPAQEDLEKLSAKQLEKSFKTNILAMFYLTQSALPYLKKNSCVINTYRLNDTAATKEAVVNFTRTTAENLMDSHIRVNAIAWGPVFTSLAPSTFSKEKDEILDHETENFEAFNESAPCYVYLACEDAAHISGHILSPHGENIFKEREI